MDTTVTAPCGCAFYGPGLRFVATSACTELPVDRDALTGVQSGRHVATARRRLARVARTVEVPARA